DRSPGTRGRRPVRPRTPGTGCPRERARARLPPPRCAGPPAVARQPWAGLDYDAPVSAPPQPGGAFQEFVALIARLRAPGGCPWDREQTHQSVKPMTIEEAYEVAEAIDAGDDRALVGELGDLLLQVVFHAQIAADDARFTIADVLAHVSEKMVRRHPHVFGDASAETPEEVLRQWEKVKEAEATA